MTLADDLGLDGRSHAIAPSLWIVRITTNGTGGLHEEPLRPCTREERRRLEAAIVARAPEPRRHDQAAPIPDLDVRIMNIIERSGAVTRPAIQTETGATTAQAEKALRVLRDAGRVRLVGHGATSRYVASPRVERAPRRG
jgi:hypothetical protein